MRFLATADIHIGRRPARVSREVAAAHSAARVWERVVDVAIEEGVAAVLVSGDLVDADIRFFEAVGALEAGLNRLAHAGIELYAVAGNHDSETLPGLADSLNHPALHLLGRGGAWERVEIENDTGETAQIFGWSFPGAYVETSALSDFPSRQVHTDMPSLGLLHADVDVAASHYHPVKTTELRSTSLDAWLVGHVHVALGCSDKTNPRVLRLGSPQGLDPGPGEQGVHGPWLIDIDASGHVSFEQTAVSGVQYESVPVDLSGVTDTAALQSRLAAELRDHVEALTRRNPLLETVVCRLHLNGTPALDTREIRKQCAALTETGLDCSRVRVIVDSTRLDLQPPVDLAEYRDEPGVLGVLAQLVDDIEHEHTPSDLQKGLLAQLAKLDNAPVFMPLSDSVADESGAHGDPKEEARELLLTQSRQLLYALIEQRRGEP